MHLKTTLMTGLAAAALSTGIAQAAAAFELKAAGYAEGATIAAENVANAFGCSGGNVSPALSWSDAPAGTQSFVLTVYDPDAPTGSGWWHWVVYNIPADAKAIPAGATAAKGLPAGAVEGRTDAGAHGYLGPCPPEGSTHRYVYTLTALKVPALDLPPEASAAMVGFMTGMNAIGKATLTLKYGR
jgi:Raf kinase inhibitor-like YbhB/YbcL family protein